MQKNLVLVIQTITNQIWVRHPVACTIPYLTIPYLILMLFCNEPPLGQTPCSWSSFKVWRSHWYWHFKCGFHITMYCHISFNFFSFCHKMGLSKSNFHLWYLSCTLKVFLWPDVMDLLILKLSATYKDIGPILLLYSSHQCKFYFWRDRVHVAEDQDKIAFWTPKELVVQIWTM